MLTKCTACGFNHYSFDPCPKGEVKLDPVVEKVRADLHRRSQLGIAKYGTVLGDNPGDHRAKLQHAYEEMLDGANYLAWAIMELDREGTVALHVSSHEPSEIVTALTPALRRVDPTAEMRPGETLVTYRATGDEPYKLDDFEQTHGRMTKTPTNR